MAGADVGVNWWQAYGKTSPRVGQFWRVGQKPKHRAGATLDGRASLPGAPGVRSVAAAAAGRGWSPVVLHASHCQDVVGMTGVLLLTPSRWCLSAGTSSLPGLYADIIAIDRPGRASVRGSDRRRARRRRGGRSALRAVKSPFSRSGIGFSRKKSIHDVSVRFGGKSLL